jgi:hypothetical protein
MIGSKKVQEYERQKAAEECEKAVREAKEKPGQEEFRRRTLEEAQEELRRQVLEKERKLRHQFLEEERAEQ